MLLEFVEVGPSAFLVNVGSRNKHYALMDTSRIQIPRVLGFSAL